MHLVKSVPVSSVVPGYRYSHAQRASGCDLVRSYKKEAYGHWVLLDIQTGVYKSRGSMMAKYIVSV